MGPVKVPELLAPAGNLEKLRIAIHYGADAVYLSGKRYGLRSYAGNFTHGEMESAVRIAHGHGVRVYVTLNIVARNDDFSALSNYLAFLSSLEVDGIIVSDPGILAYARRIVPHLPLHLSTQLSTSNWHSASFWRKRGVVRVNLARELSLAEIAHIKQKVPLEIEIFVHGSLCISYSGRCLLSSYLARRDSNRGECAHPCRWNYVLKEEKRPGDYLPIAEDERGSYIFNSKDLCLVEYLPEIIAAGVDALKIEGRMKGINYVAGVTRVYRRALDCFGKDPSGYQFQPLWLDELKKLSHRDYTTGFAVEVPDGEGYRYATSSCIRTHELVGVVKEVLPLSGEGVAPCTEWVVKLQVRNKIIPGERVEFITRDSDSIDTRLEEIVDVKGVPLMVAQPGQEVFIRTDIPVGVNDLVRKRKC